MAVICQWVVIWLQMCADMIAKALTFHLIPTLGHLQHIQYCYKVLGGWGGGGGGWGGGGWGGGWGVGGGVGGWGVGGGGVLGVGGGC